MSGKNINFDDKRSTKAPFIKTKNYLIFMTDANKILVSKNESYGTKISLKYFIDIMMMMLLDHYV